MEENALSLIQSWINSSKKKVIVLPRADKRFTCEEVLGITEHSSLGTMINHVGGLSVASGMIRHFGGENKFELSIREVNLVKNHQPTRLPDVLIVAIDVLGGLFGVASSSRYGETGHILYLPPDSYIWEDLMIGHTAFLEWSITGDTDLFYKKYGGVEINTGIPFDYVESFVPPLWVEKVAEDSFGMTKERAINTICARVGILNQIP